MPRVVLACGLLLVGTGLWGDGRAQQWFEYTSDNFIVYSDLSKARAHGLVEELELFRGIAAVITGVELPAVDRRLLVYVFRGKAEFAAISGSPFITGFYLQGNAGARIVMGPGRGRQQTRTVLFHEYVHHLMGEYSELRYPRWYSEGLAEVLSATEFRGGAMRVGVVDDGRDITLQALDPLPVETLIDPGDHGGAMFTARFYATAWLLTHYLQIGTLAENQELKAQTADYLSRFSSGEDSRTAFVAAFGMAPEAMNARLRSYRRSGFVPSISFDRPEVEVTIGVHALEPEELAFLLGDIAWRAQGDEAGMRYLSEIVATDASSARAVSLRAVIENHRDKIDEAFALAERALELAGDDPVVLVNRSHLAWDRYSKLHENGEDGSAELEDAIRYGLLALERDAENIEAHRFLWQAYAAQGDAINAARNIVAAYQLFPSSVPINFELGEFLVAEGKPDLAKRFLEYVVSWAHDSEERRKAEVLLKEIDSMATEPGDDDV